MNFSMRKDDYDEKSYVKFKKIMPAPVYGSWAKDKKKPVPVPLPKKEWWDTDAYRVSLNLWLINLIHLWFILLEEGSERGS